MTAPASLPRWGIVSTVKAPTLDVLNFVAHHLDLGVDAIHLYIDDGDPETKAALSGHRLVHVTETTAEWWAMQGKRPVRHQVRQTHNANHAASTATGLDWLAHIDVDEFLWPSNGTIAEELGRLPKEALTARVAPIESLAEDPAHPTAPDICFKVVDHKPHRLRRSREIYPLFGGYLNSGFLSHNQGKIFSKVGFGLKIKIHNAFLGEIENPGLHRLENVDLCHIHAKSFEDWESHFDYRFSNGSYRPELRPPIDPEKGGVTMHELFDVLMNEWGEDSLRRFYEEVCLATPALLEKLASHGLLRRIPLDLEAARLRHFP